MSNNLHDILQLAMEHHEAGRLGEAQALYEQILKVEHDNPDALHLSGMIAYQVGQHETALTLIQRAIGFSKNNPHYYNNLGNVLSALGRNREAISNYRKSIRMEPRFVDAYNNLGVTLYEEKQYKEAVAQYRKAIQMAPNVPQFYNNLGNSLKELDETDEAITVYRKSLELQPDYYEAWYNLGTAFEKQLKPEEAIQAYEQTIQLNAGFYQAFTRLAGMKLYQGKTDEAFRYAEHSLMLNQSSAATYIVLGNAQMKRSSQLEASLNKAECFFQKAIELSPDALDEPYLRLGVIMELQGRVDEAAGFYQKAYEVGGNADLLTRMNLTLPMIYRSKEEIETYFKRYTSHLETMLSPDFSVENPLLSCGSSVFYLAYTGKDLTQAQKNLARVFSRFSMLAENGSPSAEALCEENASEGAKNPAIQAYPSAGGSAGSRSRQPRRKPRIGFISKRFDKTHTISILNKGLLENLSREKFDVTVFSIGGDYGVGEKKAGDTHITLCEDDIKAGKQKVAEADLDILFYTDIGMDAMTYFLGLTRLAPVQCVTWGHPVTTGMKTMDYFISSKLIEPENGAGHYAETLVQLENLPVYYYRPDHEQYTKTRQDFGFKDDEHLYLCPQTLFKIHPDFDSILGDILRKDPRGKVVLIKFLFEHCTRTLQERFAQTIPDVAHRVIFVDSLPMKDFVNLMVVSDVILDPVHFGGGNTTYQAFSVNAPIVTLPGEFMRARAVAGCYRQMGFTDCVADTPESYANIAVRLATDPEFAKTVRENIRKKSDALFENHAFIEELENFFLRAVDKCYRQEQLAQATASGDSQKSTPVSCEVTG